MIPDEIKTMAIAWLKKNAWLIIVISILILVAFLSVPFLGKDNVVEQDVEKIIETETGIKVDFTP
jgi:hypothetical protein